MISDESDESDDEGFDPATLDEKTVTIEEFEFVKSKRRQIKLNLKKWVSEFQAKFKRLPTEGDTVTISTEMFDYNFVN